VQGELEQPEASESSVVIVVPRIDRDCSAPVSAREPDRGAALLELAPDVEPLANLATLAPKTK